MSATRSRTRFAAPFIVTVAAASCSKSETTSNPPPPKFPGITYRVHMANMLCYANEELRGQPPPSDKPQPTYNPPPPRAIECPPGMSGNTVFTVAQLSASECGVVPALCESTSCVKIRTPCPLPPGARYTQQLANVWMIEKRGDKCHAEEGDHDDCPPGQDCNPPAPRFVPCPPGITEADPVHIAELPDATCVIVPPGCKDTGCIGAKIACPTESPK